ncbi:hypothetical protein VISI1226_07158 [Vibrio sinaloensis DSM 21326]|uniref:Uncharacterized protein n=1 Tax=Vibrio sinaloensis DSM 21326 TaxID=945550 RepID=E8MAB6_PHOS4|nr:DUF4144 family protein [Vibrio sinaloensis]EGA69065.1 hypothetical protein VISI1226_07158 [Vibrio sinaloensis DSM 21326]
MIQWPCLLKLEGDDELIALKTEQHFEQECAALIVGQGDYLIDSMGATYPLCSSNHSVTVLSASSSTLNLVQVTDLIQKHEFAKAQICITKIQFRTLEEAIQAICDG